MPLRPARFENIFRNWPLLLFLGTAHAAEPLPKRAGIITDIPNYRHNVKIESEKVSADGKEVTFTILEPAGIFAFRLDLSGTRYSKLTLVVKNQKFCEGLDFQPEGQDTIDLKQLAGVKITQRGDDMIIEIHATALEMLKPAGRFQFINQYR